MVDLSNTTDLSTCKCGEIIKLSPVVGFSCRKCTKEHNKKVMERVTDELISKITKKENNETKSK